MVLEFIIRTIVTVISLFVFSKVSGLNASNKYIATAAIAANLGYYISFGAMSLYPIALGAVLYKEEGAEINSVILTTILCGGSMAVFYLSFLAETPAT